MVSIFNDKHLETVEDLKELDELHFFRGMGLLTCSPIENIHMFWGDSIDNWL